MARILLNTALRAHDHDLYGRSDLRIYKVRALHSTSRDGLVLWLVLLSLQFKTGIYQTYFFYTFHGAIVPLCLLN